MIIRRMENVLSTRPVYERILVNRKTKQVHGFSFEKETDPVYFEHYSYKENTKDMNKTHYEMLLYKNPGMYKLLRFKLHTWGVQTMTQLISKEKEVQERLMEKKSKMMEEVMEKGGKLKDQVLDKFPRKRASQDHSNQEEGKYK